MFKLAVAKPVENYEQGAAFLKLVLERLKIVFTVAPGGEETIQSDVAKAVYEVTAPCIEGMDAFFALAEISSFSVVELRDHHVKTRTVSRARATIAYILHKRYELTTHVIGVLLNYSTHCGAMFCLQHFDADMEVSLTMDLEQCYKLVEGRYQSDKAWKERRGKEKK